MKSNITHIIEFQQYDREDDLNSSDQRLIKAAVGALEHSYSPYSRFKVGASIYMDNQEILIGSNQENASYPLCICAEANVLSTAGSTYPKNKINTMAITTAGSTKTSSIAAPCGACRQIILEYELRQNQDIRILLYQPGLKIIEISSIKSILPLHFDFSYLIE